MVLVNLGFNVRSYEIDIKEVEKRTGSGISGARLQDRANEVDSIGAESKEITIERYRSYERINADYAFEVMVTQRTGVVKIVKAKEKAVVAVCSFDDYSLEDDIETCLSEKHMIVEKRP